ncbi:uncharacterized protein IUM83_12876 [Phytophthora cinnamomi]|uniref:uncharacterized protein n=1 Tax=Phytophthora cinnamomi TaxID=4785 RepID=UPI00355AB7B0|nr:hypothetical protein IUM83_12876 [Phytophthora cinnamomi]
MRSQLDPPPLMMQVNRCEICLEPQTLHASGLPREAVELLRTLLVLQRFVLAVPLSAYDFCFESMDFRKVLRPCADLLLDVFSSSRVRQMLAAVTATGAPDATSESRPPNVSDVCDRFSQLVRGLSDELSQLLSA